MSKKSTVKPVVKPSPARTTKTRLTKSMRDTMHRYMCDLLLQRLDSTEVDATLAALVEKTNLILRAKYPEVDMLVLRKYEMVRVDYCLRFTLPETGRVFGIKFSQPHVLRTQANLADIPCRGGCYNHDVYACDASFQELADKWEKQMNERAKLLGDKDREYNGFLLSCRYLEEVEAVVPITEDIRQALGTASRSLTVISPAVLSSIKSDFAQGVAA